MKQTYKLDLLQEQRLRQFLKLCTKSVRQTLIIFTESERPLNISVSLSMALADEAQRTEGLFRRFKSTLIKLILIIINM